MATEFTAKANPNGGTTYTASAAPTPSPYTYAGSGNLIPTPGAAPQTAGSGFTPTVVTDANIREKTIPDITQRAQDVLAPSGIVNGNAPAGSMKSANGNYVDVTTGKQYSGAPAEAAGTTPTSTSSNTPTNITAPDAPANEYDTYLQDLFKDNPSSPTEGAAPANDPYLTMLSTMKATSDKATAGLIEATQKTFDNRRAQLAATQTAAHKGLQQALIANGEARYSPILAGQRLSADETSHILALSNIDAEESSATAQLQKAQSDQDFQAMGKWLDHLDSLRSEKVTVATKLADSAAAATKAINDAKQKIADSVGKIAEDAGKNGATSEQIAAITAAPDLGSAIAAAGDTLKTYQGGMVGEYQFYVDQAKKAGQVPLDFNSYQTADANRKAKAAGAGGGSGAGVDLSMLDDKALAALDKSGFSTKYSGTTQSLATQLVHGQLAPSDLSKRTTGDAPYNAVLTAADDYSMATTGKHFNVSQANRDYKFAQRPQTQDTLNYLGSLVGSDDGTGASTGGNLDELVALSNDIKRTSFPAVNDIAAWARYSTGDPKIAAFQATATEVADQVAKILQGGGSSGTSDAKLQQAANLFNTNFTKDQLIATVNALKPLLANRAKSMIKDNAYLSDYADQFGIEQNIPGAPPTTGDSIVADETQSQNKIKTYASSHPGTQSTISTQMKSMEGTLGRPITAAEFLLAFPEYAN